MKSARPKDEPADFINAAVERLVKHQFELPVYDTLRDAAKRARTQMYQRLYEQVYQSLQSKERHLINALFQSDTSSSYTPWQRVKQESGSATPKQFRELLKQQEWLLEKNVGVSALEDIPMMRLEQLAEEAKTLDAARMMELEPKKRYTLAVILVANRCTQVMDDMGGMFVKRMMSIHKKGKKALKHYQEQQKSERMN